MISNGSIKAPERVGATALDIFIDALDWDEAVGRIVAWARSRDSRTVCLCNVHSSVTARVDTALAKALERSDMILPDGAPIAWMLRRKKFPRQPRIAGPDLMTEICARLSKEAPSIYLFGSTSDTLDILRSTLKDRYPDLQIAGSLSPRYGSWTKEEESKYIHAINQSGAGIIFIGLGCPKQEIWMVNNRKSISGVMLGVGAAFDFHAGTVHRAPKWLQSIGLEWLFRFLTEPRRLWKRYLITNSRFIWLAAKELMNK